MSSSNSAIPGNSRASGLFKGAIAGTAIGAVALLALLLLAVYLILRRQKQKKLAHPATAIHANGSYSATHPDPVFAGAAAGAAHGYDTNAKESRNAMGDQHGDMTSRYSTNSFSVPPSELSATPGGNVAGWQPYAHMAGGEVDSIRLHDSQYIEGTGPHNSQTYIAPVSNQATQSRY